MGDKTGIQWALALIEERRGEAMQARARSRDCLPGELDQLIAQLEHHNRASNWPVRIEKGEYSGSDWLLGFGEDPEVGKVYITTDSVHASQLVGHALDDAEAYVYVRNALPSIINELKRLLEKIR